MDKVRIIINKEWAEVFKNRMVLFSVAFLPLIFIALPLVTMVVMNNIGLEDEGLSAADAGFSDLPGGAVEVLCEGLSAADCTLVYMLDIFTLMFMMLPIMIPVTIAAYSVVGEKTTRSLEPLLATPITTTELLVGKSLAAIIPAVAATWLAYLIYVIGARILLNDVVFSRVVDPLWLIAIFIVGPLLSLLAVTAALIVSSRVSDPRVAEQLSGVVILPVVLVLVGQSIGLLIIDQRLVILAGFIVAILDAILVYVAVKTFQRETILTRWK